MERDSERLVIDVYLRTVVEAANLLKDLVDKYINREMDTKALQYNVSYYFDKHTELIAEGNKETGYTWLKTMHRIVGKRRIVMLSKVLEDCGITVK